MARHIATNTTVDRADMLDFVRPRHHGILTTFRRDGGPQMSPVTMGVDDDGRIVTSSYPERAKAHNARRDARVAMCVLSDEFNGPWIQVEGAAEVIDLPDAVDVLVDYYRSIAAEHPDWTEYRQAMVDQAKCAIRLTPLRWGPIATGGFPPHLADG